MDTYLSAPVLVAFAIGYLLGAIPFGLLLTRAAGLGDIRRVGSGNIGATNVLRTGHRGLAAATLVLDAVKGAGAVLIGAWLLGETAGIAAGFGAFLGHTFPVWLAFKGGKGVATYVGVLLGLSWPTALAFCAIWLAVAFVTRYSSLSALIAVLTVRTRRSCGPGSGSSQVSMATSSRRGKTTPSNDTCVAAPDASRVNVSVSPS